MRKRNVIEGGSYTVLTPEMMNAFALYPDMLAMSDVERLRWLEGDWEPVNGSEYRFWDESGSVSPDTWKALAEPFEIDPGFIARARRLLASLWPFRKARAPAARGDTAPSATGHNG